MTTVPFLITDPKRIPAKRYYDEVFFKHECDDLWPHVWQMACRLEEIPEIGDWVEYKIIEWSVIVVRTKAGIRAFHNACRHRGMQLVSGTGNCSRQGFICPFHGWRWNMDGENTFVFGPHIFDEDDLQKADISLRPCRVETWGGCAFVNFDDNAPSLLECLGPVTARLDARCVERLKVDWWAAAVLPANWKLAMEAFMEGYHAMRTHPQLHTLTASNMNRYGQSGGGAETAEPKSSREWLDLTLRSLATLSSGMAGMVHHTEIAVAETLRNMSLPEDLEAAPAAFYSRLNHEITAQGRARGVPVPDLNEIAAAIKHNAVEFLFPHYFLLPMFSAMASYRVRPLTPETCLFEIWSLALFPEGEVREPPVAPAPVTYEDPSFPEIPRQDFTNLPSQQCGLHAKGFEYMRLSHEVEGMISNYQRLIDGYLIGVAPAKLAKATQVVCSGYESPILDIGI